jgi:ATP-dependent Lon protease
LRGRVLPIGGLKEKLLAALRGGIKTVLIPEENAKDLVEIPDSVKNALEIVPVSLMDEVLSHALTRRPEAIVWDETRAKDEPGPKPSETSDDEVPGLTAH